jgi:hypothetical protein
MFGIDTVGILPFDIKNRGYLSFAAFLIAVIPLGVLIRRLNLKWPHAKKWREEFYYKDDIAIFLVVIVKVE